MEFKQAIKLYLTAKAYSDTDFAEKYNNKDKRIEEIKENRIKLRRIDYVYQDL